MVSSDVFLQKMMECAEQVNAKPMTLAHTQYDLQLPVVSGFRHDLSSSNYVAYTRTEAIRSQEAQKLQPQQPQAVRAAASDLESHCPHFSRWMCCLTMPSCNDWYCTFLCATTG